MPEEVPTSSGRVFGISLVFLVSFVVTLGAIFSKSVTTTDYDREGKPKPPPVYAVNFARVKFSDHH